MTFLHFIGTPFVSLFILSVFLLPPLFTSFLVAYFLNSFLLPFSTPDCNNRPLNVAVRLFNFVRRLRRIFVKLRK